MSIIKLLNDGTTYIKAAYLEPDKKLSGSWEVTRKLDGVRIIKDRTGKVVSRNSKSLYNVDHLEFLDAEFFYKDWNTSVSMVRTMDFRPTKQDMIYELTDGIMDQRLFIGYEHSPSFASLEKLMNEHLAMGDEGLVIRQFNPKKNIFTWLKVVPKMQADIRITGFKEGTGRLQGTLGSIQTKHGSVGSGFDDEMREAIWSNRTYLIGKIIQVEYREVTEDGKLRFPAFVRFRYDKDEEDIHEKS